MQTHVEARQRRRIDVDLGLRVRVSLFGVTAGEVRRLRRGRVGAVAARAIGEQQRIDGVRERCVTVVGGICGEGLGAADILDRRRQKLDLRAARSDAAGPGFDPGSENVGAGLRARQPAVMAAGDLQHHARLIRLRQIDDAERIVVSQIDVIGTREHRRLTARLVAVATAVRRVDVLPEIDLESLHIGSAGRGPNVAGASGSALRVGVGRGRSATRAGAEDNRQTGEQ